MAAVNKVFLLGNLTQDPELGHTKGGKEFCNFGLAINEKYGGQDRTTFIDCVAWGRTAEVVNQYCRKGSQVHIEGSLRFDQWDTPEGQRRSKLIVTVFNLQMLGGRQQKQEPAETYNTDIPF